MEETWDLSSLFPSDNAWEQALGKYEKMTAKLPSYKETLARSAESLADWMDFSRDLDMLGQRLFFYAHARHSEDYRCEKTHAMKSKYDTASAKSRTANAWANPEILAIPEADIGRFLEHPRLADYRVYIGRILRLRPHTLNAEEERIAALYEEGASVLPGVVSAFNVDTNVDMGSIDTPDGKIELKKDTEWWTLYESPDPEIRRKVSDKVGEHWDAHKNMLASFVSGKVKYNGIRARVHGYPSARAAAMFKDNVDEEVYDNLIATVGESLDSLHRYYDIRKRALGLGKMHNYDMGLPLVRPVKRRTPWNKAVELILESLAPLGDGYVSTLRSGLGGRWVDRCRNQGKDSYAGGFCIVGYESDPCIMMSYDEEKIDDLVILTHELGHAMHLLHSTRANPYRHYFGSYFESEVASIFHMEMLFQHLLKTYGDDKGMRLFLVNNRVDFFRSMVYDNIMHAEYEQILHRLDETGTPLTADTLCGEYRNLVQKYHGPELVMDASSGRNGLRYPSPEPFYTYVYATGTCAALALADRVLGGDEMERDDYIAFLKSGGSSFPMDTLKLAGVDMSRPEPVQAACRVFAGLVDELERLL
ncbi:MAG: oligoendopeptidase F family protein [Treponema sp.]|nr:oligoendopeptidase F family protein [Treponema sp.]